MTLSEAEAIAGRLSGESKMPGPAYSTPASACITGAKLRTVPGSVCSSCYAMKGNYRFKNVQAALTARLQSIEDSRWAEAVALQISASATGWFRWNGSGDIQSIQHLAKICKVCELTPDVRHWLPTKEYAIVGEYVAIAKIPANLTIRLSAYMVDGAPPAALAKRLGVQTSTVVRSGASCPAPSQGNACVTCRDCWNRSVQNVSYAKH